MRQDCRTANAAAVPAATVSVAGRSVDYRPAALARRQMQPQTLSRAATDMAPGMYIPPVAVVQVLPLVADRMKIVLGIGIATAGPAPDPAAGVGRPRSARAVDTGHTGRSSPAAAAATTAGYSHPDYTTWCVRLEKMEGGIPGLAGLER